MKSFLFTFFSFLFLLTPALQAQHLVFVPLESKASQGNLEVWRQCQGDACTFVLKADMENDQAGFGFSLTSTFEEEKMMYSVLNRYETGKAPEYAGVKWNGEAYSILKNGKFTRTHTEAISTSLTSLFFNEPTDVKWAFVEIDGEVAPIAQTSAHTFEVMRSDGERYRFFYERGVCHFMALENEHGKFGFKLQSVGGTAHSMVK